MIIDPSVAATGAFVSARTEAEILSPHARVILVLPEESRLPAGAVPPFHLVLKLPFATPTRSFRRLLAFPPKLALSAWRLARLLRAENAATLQVNDVYLLHGPLVRAFGFRGRIVTWVRLDPARFGGRVSRLLLGLASRFSDTVVAVSCFIQTRLGAVPSRVVYDLPANHRSGPLLPPPEAGALFVQIANYIEGKGQDCALEAFARIAVRHRHARLAFWGGDMGLARNADYRQRLVARAASLGLSDRVVFNGFASEPQAVLAEATAALVLSHSESFSLTCLEAAWSGRAVIATRCGGPEEILRDGETGYLVPVDDAAAVAGRMEALLRDPDLANRLGDKAAADVRGRFSFQRLERDLLEALGLSTSRAPDISASQAGLSQSVRDGFSAPERDIARKVTNNPVVPEI